MYRYDIHDQTLVDERVAQFRDQMERYQAGRLGEEEFRPLRLQNGLYIQKHAPMLRIAIPYGMLAGAQLRALADITRRYDRGYGHFTTRQNLQLNWPALEDVPDILAELSEVEMHANQTSGNCIRNTTTDQFAGVQSDEIVDPRPYCEIIRQWSTYHPEFAFLPRKFKVAVNASEHTDRAKTNAPKYASSGWASESLMQSAVTKSLATRSAPGAKLSKTPTSRYYKRWTVNVTLPKCGYTWASMSGSDPVTKTEVGTAVVIFGINENDGNIERLVTAFPGPAAVNFNATA